MELAQRGEAKAWVQAGDVARGFWLYGEHLGENPRLEFSCYLNGAFVGNKEAESRIEEIYRENGWGE